MAILRELLVEVPLRRTDRIRTPIALAPSSDGYLRTLRGAQFVYWHWIRTQGRIVNYLHWEACWPPSSCSIHAQRTTSSCFI